MNSKDVALSTEELKSKIVKGMIGFQRGINLLFSLLNEYNKKVYKFYLIINYEKIRIPH